MLAPCFNIAPTSMPHLYLSLGANLGHRETTLQTALTLLSEQLGAVVKHSTFVATQPWGFASENAFLNLAAIADTSLSPLEALAVTQNIERQLGRTEKTATKGYADRTIDIDLLFFEGGTFESEALVLPHRYMLDRRFVLAPLAEIAPEVIVPGTEQTVAQHLQHLNERFTIDRLTTPSAQHLEAFQRLLPQLTGRPTTFSANDMAQLCANPLTAVYFLSDEEGQLQATCSLCYATSPTGMKAWLEDVVVDDQARGRGYAKHIVRHAISAAKAQGAKSLNLTSRPTRIAANRLYQSLGFEQRETNVYSMTF